MMLPEWYVSNKQMTQGINFLVFSSTKVVATFIYVLKLTSAQEHLPFSNKFIFEKYYI